MDVFFGKGIFFIILTLYWILTHIQTVCESIMYNYHKEFWEWGCYNNTYNKLMNIGRQSHNKRIALHNTYLLLKSKIKKNNNSQTMTYYPSRLCHSTTQIFSRTYFWEPIFADKSFDIHLKARSTSVDIVFKAFYTTVNKTYMWGILNTDTNEIIGRTRLEPGKNKSCGVKFTISNIDIGEQYNFRFVQYKKEKSWVYLYCEKELQVTINHFTKK